MKGNNNLSYLPEFCKDAFQTLQKTSKPLAFKFDIISVSHKKSM